MATAWKDLTKEERSERIKEGRDRARQDRAHEASAPEEARQPSPVDLATAIAQAMVAVQNAQATKPAKDPKDMTLEERKIEHERLQKELDNLPFLAEHVGGVEPGTVIGTGLVTEYAPYTKEWFLDVETRRKDRNVHNGQPTELRWPNYQLHEVIYQGNRPYEEVTINGVGFAITPGNRCLLPTPHYGLYLEKLDGLRKHEERFAPPTNPQMVNGYVHVKYSDNGRMLAVLLGKGPLDGMPTRESNDRPA